jgi:hypothetical protein
MMDMDTAIKEPLDILDRVALIRGKVSDDYINNLLWDTEYLDAINSDPDNKKITDRITEFLGILSKEFPSKSIVMTGAPDREHYANMGMSFYWHMRKSSKPKSIEVDGN